MFYCEQKKPELRKVMRAAGLRELNFRFDFEGSKVIFDAVSRDGRLAHIQRQSHHESERKLIAKLLPPPIPVNPVAARIPRVVGAANHRGSGRSI
jgi:hypothetical protein